MNMKLLRAESMPDFFSNLKSNAFDDRELRIIHKILRNEFLKQAYRNRGFDFVKDEIHFGSFKAANSYDFFGYLFVRYSPNWILKTAKRIMKNLATND